MSRTRDFLSKQGHFFSSQFGIDENVQFGKGCHIIALHKLLNAFVLQYWHLHKSKSTTCVQSFLNFARSIGLHKIVLYCSVSTSGIYCFCSVVLMCLPFSGFWGGASGKKKRRKGRFSGQFTERSTRKLIILYMLIKSACQPTCHPIHKWQ